MVSKDKESVDDPGQGKTCRGGSGWVPARLEAMKFTGQCGFSAISSKLSKLSLAKRSNRPGQPFILHRSPCLPRANQGQPAVAARTPGPRRPLHCSQPCLRPHGAPGPPTFPTPPAPCCRCPQVQPLCPPAASRQGHPSLYPRSLSILSTEALLGAQPPGSPISKWTGACPAGLHRRLGRVPTG